MLVIGLCLCLTGVAGAACPGEGCFIVPEGIAHLVNRYTRYHDVEPEQVSGEPGEATCIHLPGTVTARDGYMGLMYYTEITNIEVAADHPTLRSIDGVLFSKDGKELLMYPIGRQAKAYHIPEGTERVTDECAFQYGTVLETLYLPESFSQLPTFLLYRVDTFTAYEVAEGNPYFQSVDGVLFAKDGKELVAYPCGRTQQTYAVPEGTEEVGFAAFSTVRHLEEVMLPGSLRSIGGHAFEDARALRHIDIPNLVTDIGSDAFRNCRSLKRIQLPAALREISARLFVDTGLEGALVIPEGVTAIGDEALCYQSGLTDIYLPSSLKMRRPERHAQGLSYFWELNIGGGEETLENCRTVLHAPPGTFAAELALASPYPVMLEASPLPGEAPDTTQAALGAQYTRALEDAGFLEYRVISHAALPDMSLALAVVQKGVQNAVCAFAKKGESWQLLWRNPAAILMQTKTRWTLFYLREEREWLLRIRESPHLEGIKESSYLFDASLALVGFSWERAYWGMELEKPFIEGSWQWKPQPGYSLEDFDMRAFLE